MVSPVIGLMAIIIPFVGFVAYDEYAHYQRAKARLKEEKERHDICRRCRHERWYHTTTREDPLYIKCHEFADDQLNLRMCTCTKFELDNLLLLEQLAEERGRL